MPPAKESASDVTDADARGSLFDNLAFWLSSAVPQRTRFIELIQARGGSVVKLEKDADYRLVDHTRKDLPRDSYSYQFVERSIQKGELENPETHRMGPASFSGRPVGSSTIRAKSRRTRFTAEDDQMLYDWVKRLEKLGEPIRGNKIYQELEEKYPHHTFQSWRDRYLRIKDLPRPVTHNTAGTSSHEVTGVCHPSVQQEEQTSTQSIYENFTEPERRKLLDVADNVLQVEPSAEDDAWAEFAKANPEHDASEWKAYFNNFVRPQHVASKQRETPSIPTRANPQAKSRKPASTSANIVSPDSRPKTPQSTERLRAPRTTKGDEDVEVHTRREQGVPAAKSRGAADVSLEKKRRHTTDDRGNMAAGDTATPSRKRRATDYPSREAVWTSKSQKLTVPSGHPPGRGYTPTKTRAADVTNSASGVPGGVNGSRRPWSDAELELEETQFETARQFPSVEGRNGVHIREDDDLGDLVDTTLPMSVEHDEEIDGDENDAEDIKQLDDWIESRVRTGKAADEMQVMEALRSTTMDPDLADRVLPYLKAGKSVPTNLRGVWTAQDDECMEGQNAEPIEKMYKKHGEELASARFRYLDMRRAVMDRSTSA